MNRNMSLLLIAGVIAVAPAGCGNSEPSGSAATAGTGSAAPGKAGDSSAKAKSVPVDEFLSKIAPTTCTWIDQCKNEKVKALTSMMGMMIAGFGSMDKPELAKQMKSVEESMKNDKRSMPNKQECETIGGVVLQITGLTKEALQAKIGKTVQYDGEKAAACLASLASPFAPCSTEVKLTSEPKMADIEAFEKELEAPLDAHTKACEGVFTGTVEAGQACEYELECKGEHSKCKAGAADPKAKTCQAGTGKH